MCLIAFNWQDHPVFKMVLIANRDEYYQRPSSPIHLWEEGFYAGRDLKGGGTWMGIHPNGRFAALTNYRDMANETERCTTRGELVVNFLSRNISPLDYLQELQQNKNQYNGFSLLVSDGARMFYISNYQKDIQEVEPGNHGLSNAFLNSPWPKVQSAKKDLFFYLQKTPNPEIDEILTMLQSTRPASTEMLPQTGLNATLEKSVSAQFIAVDDYYGTVNTTALLWTYAGEVLIRELRHVPDKLETTVEFIVKAC